MAATATPPGETTETDFTEIPLDDGMFGDNDMVTNLDEETSDDAQDTEPEPAESKTEETAEEPAPKTGEDRVAELAKEYGLDPKDPAQRAALEKIASKQAPAEESIDINDLYASLDETKPAAGSDTPAKESPAPEPSAPKGDLKFNDAGDEWKTPLDGVKAMAEALDAVNNADDASRPVMQARLNDVQSALFTRQFVGMGLPIVAQLMEARISKAIESHLGDIKPIVDRIQARERDTSSQNKAIEMLTGKLGDGFSAMMKIDGEGSVKFNGEEYDSTPFNRIVAENPFISDIRRDDPDPQKAAVKTYLARFHAAYQIFQRNKSQQTSSAKAISDAARAGATSSGKTTRDDTRRNLTAAGKTSDTALTGKKGEPDEAEEIADIIRRSQGGAMSQLFSK